MCGFGVQTQNYLEATKSIYPVGCADRAVLWIESHLLLVGALALGLSLPQVTHVQGLHTEVEWGTPASHSGSAYNKNEAQADFRFRLG